MAQSQTDEWKGSIQVRRGRKVVDWRLQMYGSPPQTLSNVSLQAIRREQTNQPTTVQQKSCYHRTSTVLFSASLLSKWRLLNIVKYFLLLSRLFFLNKEYFLCTRRKLSNTFNRFRQLGRQMIKPCTFQRMCKHIKVQD